MSNLPDLNYKPGYVIHHDATGAYRIIYVQQTLTYRICSLLFRLFGAGKERW